MGSYLLLFLLAEVALVSGRFAKQRCDLDHPCPSGSSCRHSRMVPGVKMCLYGSTTSSKRSGRCPTVDEQTITTNERYCCFDDHCPDEAQRCCAPNGQEKSVCISAIDIPPAPTVTVLIPGEKGGLLINCFKYGILLIT